jgi:hypothetical protein
MPHTDGLQGRRGRRTLSSAAILARWRRACSSRICCSTRVSCACTSARVAALLALCAPPPHSPSAPGRRAQGCRRAGAERACSVPRSARFSSGSASSNTNAYCLRKRSSTNAPLSVLKRGSRPSLRGAARGLAPGSARRAVLGAERRAHLFGTCSTSRKRGTGRLDDSSMGRFLLSRLKSRLLPAAGPAAAPARAGAGCRRLRACTVPSCCRATRSPSRGPPSSSCARAHRPPEPLPAPARAEGLRGSCAAHCVRCARRVAVGLFGLAAAASARQLILWLGAHPGAPASLTDRWLLTRI